ncbi:sugar phosphate isomerase/epimerase [Salinibacterium sp. NK8237]|uniref:sugar phosphate isomerase/epimerase family protein n=1 Tax=Salinibacterium sp. NK8237 TaxID=2792038 RepID=UPI0018CEBE14|nr:TIM barrel protein [Salinibacterium sp. NK8237]MBH0131158.1 sugar phosphate isomerase/epimerase [Salinibacterium sp. NK8237]
MTDVTWTLSGFGDEIGDDPHVQVAVLQALDAKFIEVRSAWGTNIIDLDEAQLDQLAAVFSEREMGVSAIASPVGKVDVSLPVDHELERLTRAITAAHRLDSPYIRIFSFFRDADIEVESIRDEVLLRMKALADLAERESIVLLHENEKDIYGDTPGRVLDIIESVGSHALKVAWDNANFVQVGVKPFTDGFALLRPHLEYLQVKDAIASTGEVVPAGEGDGELLETVTALRDSGFSGFTSLEPHLSMNHALGGFSGPEAFGRAARAFAQLTSTIGVKTQ